MIARLALHILTAISIGVLIDVWLYSHRIAVP
jgi:hypothetical protein